LVAFGENLVTTSAGTFRAHYVTSAKADSLSTTEESWPGDQLPPEAQERVGAIILSRSVPGDEYDHQRILYAQMKMGLIPHNDVNSVLVRSPVEVPATRGSMYLYDGTQAREIASDCDLRCAYDEDFLKDFVEQLIAKGAIKPE